MEPQPVANIPHLASELQKPSAVRTLVVEGSPAARTQLVITLAAHLKYQLVQPNSAPIDSTTQTTAILFFDEADTLFARRTDIRDSHDRYTNSPKAFNGLIIYGVTRAASLPSGLLEQARVISIPPH